MPSLSGFQIAMASPIIRFTIQPHGKAIWYMNNKAFINGAYGPLCRTDGN
jgi:hypothetical protein